MSRRRIAWLVGGALLLLVLFLLLRHKPVGQVLGKEGDEAGERGGQSSSALRAPAPLPELEGLPGQLPPPDLPRATLRGKVIESDGSAVPGAEVAILRYPPGERVPGMAKRVQETGGDGTFAFDDLMVGEYLLEARKGSRVSASVPVELTESSEPATLMLVRGAVLVVEVRDLVTDEPVPGALVRLGVGDREFGGTDAYTQQRADEQGVATFEGVAAAAMHAVYAEADGYLPVMKNLLPGANPDPNQWRAQVHLDPDVATVTGRVIDVRGTPVAGAKVGWSLGESESLSGVIDSLPMPRLEGAAISGEDGSFELRVKPGLGCVVAIPPGRRLGETCGVSVRPNTVAEDVEIVIEDGVKLSGVVRRRGENVPGATVLVTLPQWAHMPMFANTYRFRTSSDRNGRFEFVGVDPDELLVYAMDDESSSELVAVDLRSGEDVSEVVVELEHTGQITGRVTDEDGEGVPFAAVWYFAQPDHDRESVIEEGKEVVYPETYTKAASTGHLLTDPDGNFVIKGLPPSSYAIKVGRTSGSSVPPSYARVQKLRVKLGEHVELVLPKINALRGQVVYEDGKPVTHFRISFAYYSTSYDDRAFAPPHEIESEDGYFSIPEVPDGRYGLEITGPEVVPLRLNGPIVVGGDTDLGRIEVAYGVERVGVVKHTDDQPAPSVKVLIATPGGGSKYKTEQTGAGGKFHVPAIRPGDTIRMRAEQGQLTADWKEFPADGPVELVLRAGAKGSLMGVAVDDYPLEGRVALLTQTGEGLPGVELPIVEMTDVDASGKFEIFEVSTGSYSLWVRRHPSDSAGEWWLHPVPVKIQNKEDAQVVANLTGPSGSTGEKSSSGRSDDKSRSDDGRGDDGRGDDQGGSGR